MLTIGLLKETKLPPDNRVALSPTQCKWIKKKYSNVNVVVQSCSNRCFSDKEYKTCGIEVVQDLSDCDILIGIKEVKVDTLVPNKTYLFFSHTKKKQPYNQPLLKAIVDKGITLIDFECLEHEDGQRIIGFGFFAGIVGAHNGIMAFGKRTGAFELGRVYQQKSFKQLIHTYFGLKLPNIRIAVTGSGRVSQGIKEILNLLGIVEVEKEMFIQKTFNYPVYVHLKGSDLYKHKEDKKYNRDDFHANPQNYVCKFSGYLGCTDILMNGVYWDKNIPRLFEKEDVANKTFNIQTIADITDDTNGSVPINIGDQSIEDPVYGIDKETLQKTAPYLPGSVDVMAVGNLPNELPRDASRYFGEQLIKYVLPDLLHEGSDIIDRASITKDGKLTEHFSYLQDYVDGKV